MTADELSLAEAVPLGYALVLRAAADVGARALGIKGPLLAVHGLREPRTSVDVDVLVAPSDVAALQERLAELGWLDDGAYDTPDILPQHSITHRHALWPCEIDLHSRFPGFLADPADVFDVLWSRRFSAVVAGVEVDACDRVGMAAIAGLHYLRDRYRRPEVEALAEVIRRTWATSDVADLAGLAADTGAVEPLLPLLEMVDAPTIEARVPTTVDVADWQMRSGTSSMVTLPWIVGLGRVAWWRRPAFVARAVWLDRAHFEAVAHRPLSHQELREARRARWRRGWSAFPTAWREYRRLRR